jgi:hypothetical protein
LFPDNLHRLVTGKNRVDDPHMRNVAQGFTKRCTEYPRVIDNQNSKWIGHITILAD